MTLSPASPGHKLAIAGGGISGLTAALAALQNGQKGSDIHIYEATTRLGGKIENSSLDGHVVDKGPEFVDHNSELLKICQTTLQPYGVKLIACTEQETESFQRLDGTLMSGKDFCAAFSPIAKRIIADREEAEKNPDGEVARRLDRLSVEEYLSELQKTVPVVEERTTLQWLRDTLTFKTNRVDPQIVEMAKRAYCLNEAGRLPQETSARLFVGETCPSTERFLSSDCGFRVEGGMESIVHALHKHLKSQGVQFHHDAPVQSVSRHNGKNKLVFANGLEPVECDKAILALPAYELAQVQGLEALGLSAEHAKLIGQAQYADNLKFTVRLKDGAKLPEANFYSSQGYQCWSPKPGFVTFLCSRTALAQHKTPKKLVEHCLQDYAKSNRIDPTMLCDGINAQTVVFNNPGKKWCYGAPAPGQMVALQRFSDALDALAANGLGISGTYIPYEGSVGFMNNGVEASKRCCASLYNPGQSKWREHVMAQQLPSPTLPNLRAAQTNRTISI